MKIIDLSNSNNIGQIKDHNSLLNSPRGSFVSPNSKPPKTSRQYSFQSKPEDKNTTKNLSKSLIKPTNCKSYLLRLVNTKDYSYQELLSKAMLKNFEEEEVSRILNEFVEYRFVDERRLCEGLINIYKGNKGANWIFQKLLTRKVDREIIIEMMSDIESNPDIRVKELVMRKYKISDFAGIDINIKKKILLFLASRGFPNVSKILNDWISNSK